VIDLQILEDHGLTHDNLKLWFSEDPESLKQVGKEQKESVQALRDHIRARILSGRDWNLSHYAHYHALDLAWDTPFRQVNPTLIQSLAGQEVTDEKCEVWNKLKSWGIDPTLVVQDVPDPKVKGKSIKRVNLGSFYQLFVPLVRSYGTVRWAKIVNDRRLVPFFKYEPAIDTKENRLKCDVITSRVEVMSRQMGYFEVLKQSVFQMLHYGVCLQFPVEEWYTEEQLVRDNSAGKPEAAPEADEEELVTLVEPPPATASTTADKKGVRKIVVKEGLRHHMPHPTRTFWDQAHRISTFNSDTGCEYAGYWRVLRFKDIYTNTDFWNRDLIPLGNQAWWNAASTYFQTVYRCSVKFPDAPAMPVGTKDREAHIEQSYYSGVNNADHTVMLTEYFEKIIPKQWGLGSYEHPVWFRFVVCGDSGTIIYAAPLPYCPAIIYAYDSDELREQNASLSLEILPFQDQYSQFITQYILTTQHNLTNLTMFDKDQFEDEKVIDDIENSWASRWIRRTIVRFSGRKSMRAQQSTPNAAFSINFTPIPTREILDGMKVILDTLERVLVMSSQEVAQAASHEQTREEVRHIAQQQSTRLQFTTTPVDLACEAWKRQIYEGLMAYGSGEFYAQVPFETPLDKKAITALALTFHDDKETDEERYHSRRTMVKVKDKTALSLESFASSRDGEDRINNQESGIALLTFLRDITNSPYGPAIGPDQFVMLANEAARMLGLPRDVKIVNKMPKELTPGSPEHQQAAKDQMSQIVQTIEAQIVPKIFEALKKPLNDLQGGVKESLEMDVGQTAAIKSLGATLAHLQAALGVSPMPPTQDASLTTNAPALPPTQPGTQAAPPGMVGA
jgi:hypothetical protein